MANPSRLFILRPVATALLTAAILLAGSVAYLLLPISALPQVDYPTIQILTFYPGASPDVMRSEEHTSELQSQSNIVCRLLLEKKKNDRTHISSRTWGIVSSLTA